MRKNEREQMEENETTIEESTEGKRERKRKKNTNQSKIKKERGKE